MDCRFMNGHAIQHCEEYGYATPSNSIEVSEAAPLNGVAVPGLCGSCLHVESCSLRRPNEVIFYCNHFE